MRDHFHPSSPGKRLQGRSMQGYDHSTPRAALGLTAVFMAAITMSAMVVLPAKFDSVHADSTMLAAAKTTIKTPIAVEGSQACVDGADTENRQANGPQDQAARDPQEFPGNRKFSSRSISSI
jgi:hypothetical protein